MKHGETVTVLKGYQDILAHEAGLRELAARCGQAGIVDDLRFFLSPYQIGAKIPYALIFKSADRGPYAASFVNEYRVGGLRTGVFIPSDFGGERTVLADEGERAQVACQSARVLLERGGRLALFSMAGEELNRLDSAEIAARCGRGAAAATCTRTIRRNCAVEDSYARTLAKMGRETRRNFRRCYRKLQEEVGATFVEEPSISEADFLELNRKSAYPVVARVARWRLQTARYLPGSFIVGLKASDGRWISLLGGRRKGTVTSIDWQVNSTQFERFSVATAMRAVFLERECDRGGARYVRFEGGTRHPMHFHFVAENVGDLLAARPSMMRRIVDRVLPWDGCGRNLLATWRRSVELTWHDSVESHPVKSS